MTTGKCICQICTCGRHRCPHNRGTIGTQPVKAQCELSEYQCAYETLPKQAPRETIYPPVREHTSSNTPMQISTMYKDTYVAHEHQACIVQPKREYSPPNKLMSMVTTYTKDYKGKPGKRSENYKPDHEYQSSGTKFHNKTIYRASYHGHSPEAWKLCRATPIRHKECIERNNGRFEGTSTMKDDFKKHENPERAELIRPKQEENSQNAKFEGETTYKVEYIEKKREPTPFSHPHAEYKPSNIPFVGTTTFMRDYQPHLNPKRMQCYKPQNDYQPCKTKFEAKSTASTAYQSWPVQKLEKPLWAQQKVFEQPKVPFTQSSSYQEDFQRPDSGYKRAQLKPQKGELTLEQNRSDPYDYCHTTHYREQYIEYQNAAKPTTFKITQVYEAPKEPVLGESVYQAKYTGEQSARAKPCIPVVESDNHERKSMTFATTYKETYKGEQQLECPAKGLCPKLGSDTKSASSSTGGGYQRTGSKNGHQYFRSAEPEPKKDVQRSIGSAASARGTAEKGTGTATAPTTSPKPADASCQATARPTTGNAEKPKHPSVTQLNQTIAALKAEIQSRADSCKGAGSAGKRDSPSFCNNCCQKLGARNLARSAKKHRGVVVKSTTPNH